MLPESPDWATTRRSTVRLSFALLTIFFAILFLAPVGKGDLPGYDDALYAHLAKSIFTSGDWLHLMSNGYPALEHPPLLPWMQAALFSVFGMSDEMARLPTAICGFGTVLLVFWLTRKLFADDVAALFSMFCMGTSIYFLKYAARAMTDVPFAFFFLCAICCWKMSKSHPAWLLGTALFTAAAQMTRGMMGLTLPLIFVADLLLNKRRISPVYAGMAVVIAFGPPVTWYLFLSQTYGEFFRSVHAHFLAKDLTTPNPLKPLVFAFMLAKSYWPWLPAMLAGLWLSRSRLLLCWICAVFAACTVVRNPVLRYLLPAYPAFAIAAGIAIRTWIPERRLRPVLVYILPAVAASVASVAVWLPAHHDAAALRRMAAAASDLSQPNERIGFYDGGAPRFDESNLLQWYGSRNLYILENRSMLDQSLRSKQARVLIIDTATFNSALAADFHEVTRAGVFSAVVRNN